MRSWHDLKESIMIVFIKRPENNNNNTLNPSVQFDYLAYTLASSSCTRRMCALLLREFTFLFVCTGVFACVLKMQVKFPSHLLQPHHSLRHSLWSHFLQQCFEVYLHWDWLAGAPFPSSVSPLLHSLSPLFPFFLNLSFSIFPTLLTFSLPPNSSFYPFL